MEGIFYFLILISTFIDCRKQWTKVMLPFMWSIYRPWWNASPCLARLLLQVLLFGMFRWTYFLLLLESNLNDLIDECKVVAECLFNCGIAHSTILGISSSLSWIILASFFLPFSFLCFILFIFCFLYYSFLYHLLTEKYYWIWKHVYNL